MLRFLRIFFGELKGAPGLESDVFWNKVGAVDLGEQDFIFTRQPKDPLARKTPERSVGIFYCPNGGFVGIHLFGDFGKTQAMSAWIASDPRR